MTNVPDRLGRSFSADPLRPHPFCNVCGWRKGGIDSWNGTQCKCGHSAGPLPSLTDFEIIEMAQRMEDEIARAAKEAGL